MKSFLASRRFTFGSTALCVALLASTGVLRAAPPLDVTSATIAEIQTAMTSGTLTAEKLTQLYLARIQAFNKGGPAINAVITLNPKALESARALDAERKTGKVRGPLHGVPIVLKDNIDTYDLPTTGGSQLLADRCRPTTRFSRRNCATLGSSSSQK